MTGTMLSEAREIGEAFHGGDGAVKSRLSTTAVLVGLEARQQLDCLVSGGRKPDQTSMQYPAQMAQCESLV